MAVCTLVATTLHCPAKHEPSKVTNPGTSPVISLFSLQLGQHNSPVVPRWHPKSRTCFSQSLAPAPRCSSHRTGTHGARPWAGTANSSEIKPKYKNPTISLGLTLPCAGSSAHVNAQLRISSRWHSGGGNGGGMWTSCQGKVGLFLLATMPTNAS